VFLWTAPVYAGGKKESAPAPKEPVELHVYAGAGLRGPAEKLFKSFEEATGNTVTVEWAGMGQLVTRYQATGVGDVFLSGAESYVEDLGKEGKVVRSERLTYHTAVMAVRKDKAGGISSFADLAKSKLRIAMGDPQAIALGKSGEVMLDKSGYGDALRSKVIARATTAPQLSMYLLNGDVDAAIIGRTDAIKNADALVILPTPEGTPQEISAIASLSTSEHPDAADALVSWFARPENIQVFVDEGYLLVQQ
jgi:molybdate transport system substrate-binding protein